MRTERISRLGTFASVILLPFVPACGSTEPSPYDLDERGQTVVNTSEFRELGSAVQAIQETEDGQVRPFALTEEQAVVSGDKPISREEREQWQAQLAEHTDVSPPKPKSPTDAALEHAASRPAEELVPLVLVLDEPGFDFRRFQMAKAVADTQERDQLRAELIAEREEQLERANRGVVRERLIKLGARVEGALWINNSITANVPAGAVAQVAAMPEVEQVFYEDPKDAPEPGTSGTEIRSELLVNNFHAAGYNGADGNDATTTAVKIAIIEADGATNFVNRDHDGFDQTSGGSTRITHIQNCTSGACATSTNVNTAGSSHATQVAWAAAGSIEEGQDSSYPGTSTADQRARSGVATEATIQMYYTVNYSDIAAAVAAAVSNDADIINISIHSSTRECQDTATPETKDESALNAALRNAMNMGVLVVQITGNYHNSGDTCSATYPAWRPHVLSVGGVATAGSTTIDNAFLYTASGRGQVPYVYDGNRVVDSVPTVGVVAPSTIENYFSGTSSYASSATGTSYAAPMVAGSAALLKHAFYAVSVPTWSTSAQRLLTNMLLMGNGWWVNALEDDWGLEMGTSSQWASRNSGFGKLRMHYPYDSTMGSNRRWLNADISVTDGGAFKAIKANPDASGVNQPLPSSVTQLKWNATVFPDELTDNGSIGFEVFDAACNSTTPWTGTHLAHDWTGSGRTRIQLTGASIQSKCIFLVIKPYFTPGGATTTVYNAFYWHSGSTGVH